MREIKFRAWDTEREVMATVNHIGLNDYEVSMQDEECICWRAPYPYVCKLMQWTGLKDSNDKEIYEGDIIKIEDFYGEDLVGKVIFDKPYASYLIMECEEERHFKMSFDNLESYVHEVIGNIYENKDLLENK